MTERLIDIEIHLHQSFIVLVPQRCERPVAENSKPEDTAQAHSNSQLPQADTHLIFKKLCEQRTVLH